MAAMSEASPSESSLDRAGPQRLQQVRRLTAVVGGVFLALGLANLLRGLFDQSAVLIGAGSACMLAVWWRSEQRWPGQALALTILSIVVVSSCAWLGDGLLDSGNYAYPAVLGMASLVLDRRGFVGCTVLVAAALGLLGWADTSGWWHWAPPQGGWWHVLDMVVITGASATIAGLIMLDVRRTLSDMQARDTALRAANERLAASEARFRELFETAPIGLLRLGTDGRIAEVNGALAAALPFAPLQALAAGTDPGSDYRALVCLFLYGGNDANNLLVPTDSARHALYARPRPNLALPRESLVALASAAGGASGFGVHPAFAPLAPLFASGQAAVVANAGTLVVPTTRAQYAARSVPLPANLFSHSDQQNAWQSALVDVAARNGWGGRLLERLVAAGSNNRGYSAISLAGANLWQGGDRTLTPYRVSSSGQFGFDFYDPAGSDPLSAAINSLLGEARSDPFEQTWATMMGRSIDSQRVITAS